MEGQHKYGIQKKYPNLFQAFVDLEETQLDLFSQKMLDYGIDNIKAGTELGTQEEIKFALSGIWFRMMDKMNRWKNMQMTGQSPVNESLQDTFKDLANYAMIANLVSTGKWKK